MVYLGGHVRAVPTLGTNSIRQKTIKEVEDDIFWSLQSFISVTRASFSQEPGLKA
jgi:hypothetical protein